MKDWSKVDELRKTGLSAIDACKQLGWSVSSYYARASKSAQPKHKRAYTKRLKPKYLRNASAKPLTIPVAEAPRRYLAIVGTSQELAAFARSLS